MRTVLALLVLVGGCAPAHGDVVMSASGEEAAVEGYPTSTGIAFTDGWSLSIDREIISIDGLYLHHGGIAAPVSVDHVLVNLHDGVLQPIWNVTAVDAVRYDDVGYRVVPATSDARRVGTVRDEDVGEMTDHHIAFLLDGSATHPVQGSYSLRLRIPMQIQLSHCQNAVDLTDGLVVQSSGTTQANVTFHLDHLFFDSADDPTPNIRFEAYAAAAGMDHPITFDDLAGQALADLRDIDGTPLTDDTGGRLLYDPGSTPLSEPTLRAFVFNQATTIGHFNGEGHCEYTSVPVGP